MKRSSIAIIMILVGIGIINYPKAKDIKIAKQQEYLIKQWEGSLKVIDNNVGVEKNDRKYNVLVEDPTYLRDNDVMLEVNQGDNKKDVSNNIEGRLKIKKIDLSLPILKGASKENLKKSVASLEGTGSIGKVGNYCIAGHRSQAYGRNFNRLDELEVGDELVIETLEKEYNYVIEKILC